MSSKKSKYPENSAENSSNSKSSNIALWIQIISTLGLIAVAGIGAYQAISIAQLGREATTPIAIPTATSIPISIPAVVNPNRLTLLERIDFDYEDSPIKHGWVMLASEAKEEDLNIEHPYDPFVGRTLSITSTVKYGMDFKVGAPATQGGKVVEFVADFAEGATILTYVSLARDDGSTTKGWLKLTTRRDPPKRVDDDEWQLSIKHVSSEGGDWLLYRIDLQEAISQTFGNDRLKFQQLEKLRIRGNLALDSISIFGTEP